MTPSEEQAIETVVADKPAESTLVDNMLGLVESYLLYLNDHPIIGFTVTGMLIELLAFGFGAPEWVLILIPAITFGAVGILSIVFVGFGLAFAATKDNK